MNPDDPINSIRYSYECQPIVNPHEGGLKRWEIKVTGTVEAYVPGHGHTLGFWCTRSFSEIEIAIDGYDLEVSVLNFAERLTQAVRDKLAEKVMIARLRSASRGKSQKYYNRTVRW